MKENENKDFDLRMTQFEVDEQTSECNAILEQTNANLKALAQVKEAMIQRLEQLSNVEIVKLTRRQRNKRDAHNSEMKALQMLGGSMNVKAEKLGNETR